MNLTRKTFLSLSFKGWINARKWVLPNSWWAFVPYLYTPTEKVLLTGTNPLENEELSTLTGPACQESTTPRPNFRGISIVCPCFGWWHVKLCRSASRWLPKLSRGLINCNLIWWSLFSSKPLKVGQRISAGVSWCDLLSSLAVRSIVSRFVWNNLRLRRIIRFDIVFVTLFTAWLLAKGGIHSPAGNRERKLTIMRLEWWSNRYG